MIARTFSTKSQTIRHILFIVLTVPLLMVTCFGLFPSQAQTKTPYSKERLLAAIRTNKQTGELSTGQLVEYLEQRGVDFEMTPADEARFRSAGAAPEVIVAINDNYRPPKGFGSLTINSTVAGCRVFLNGQVSGTTDQNGILRLRSLKVGNYNLTLKKESYEEQQRSITILSGTAMKESFSLALLKGQLTVVPSIADAQVKLGGMDYPTGISGLSLPPQMYDVQVSKPGFKTFTKTVTISPGQPLTIEAPLEPLPIEESLAQVVSFFQAHRYREAISSGRQILASHPDNPQANLMIGLSYYYAEQYSASSEFLTRAITLGEQVVLPIKHHHGGLGDGLCTGRLTVGRGVVAFDSIDRADHSFSAPASKIYELTSEPGKFSRIHVKVGIQNGSKEDKRTINFHVIHAFLVSANPNDPAALTFVRCNNCGQEAQLIYQLLRQLKDAPTQPSSAPHVESDTGIAGRPTLRRLDTPGKSP